MLLFYHKYSCFSIFFLHFVGFALKEDGVSGVPIADCVNKNRRKIHETRNLIPLSTYCSVNLASRRDTAGAD